MDGFPSYVYTSWYHLITRYPPPACTAHAHSATNSNSIHTYIFIVTSAPAPPSQNSNVNAARKHGISLRPSTQ